MKHAENTFERIEAYLAGTLGGNDLTEFETKLKDDPEFARQVSLHKGIGEMIRDDRELELQASLEELGQQFISGASDESEKETVIIKPFWNRTRIISSLAAAIALLFLFFILNRPASPLSNAELYSQNYQPMEVPATISDQVGFASVMKLGLDSYNSGDYETALGHLNTVLKMDSSQHFIRLFTGICLMELSQDEKAEIAFLNLIDIQNSEYRNDARWYLAMLYLRQDNAGEAKSLLRELVDGKNTYSEKANQILNRIN